jgi:hypothetical protein
MTTNRSVPSVLKVQLKMTLEFGGSGLGWVEGGVRFARPTFKLCSYFELNISANHREL